MFNVLFNLLLILEVCWYKFFSDKLVFRVCICIWFFLFIIIFIDLLLFNIIVEVGCFISLGFIRCFVINFILFCWFIVFNWFKVKLESVFWILFIIWYFFCFEGNISGWIWFLRFLVNWILEEIIIGVFLDIFIYLLILVWILFIMRYFVFIF